MLPPDAQVTGTPLGLVNVRLKDLDRAATQIDPQREPDRLSLGSTCALWVLDGAVQRRKFIGRSERIVIIQRGIGKGHYLTAHID